MDIFCSVGLYKCSRVDCITSVIKVTGYGLDGRGSFPDVRHLSLLHHVQTGSEFHPVSYPMDNRCLFPQELSSGSLKITTYLLKVPK
jgi:hypothetical protein